MKMLIFFVGRITFLSYLSYLPDGMQINSADDYNQRQEMEMLQPDEKFYQRVHFVSCATSIAMSELVCWSEGK